MPSIVRRATWLQSLHSSSQTLRFPCKISIALSNPPHIRIATFHTTISIRSRLAGSLIWPSLHRSTWTTTHLHQCRLSNLHHCKLCSSFQLFQGWYRLKIHIAEISVAMPSNSFLLGHSLVHRSSALSIWVSTTSHISMQLCWVESYLYYRFLFSHWISWLLFLSWHRIIWLECLARYSLALSDLRSTSDLSYNLITAVPSGTFSKVPAIVDITLRANLIETVEAWSFSDLYSAFSLFA